MGTYKSEKGNDLLCAFKGASSAVRDLVAVCEPEREGLEGAPELQPWAQPPWGRGGLEGPAQATGLIRILARPMFFHISLSPHIKMLWLR